MRARDHVGPTEDAARRPAPTRARQADLLPAPTQVLGGVDRPGADTAVGRYVLSLQQVAGNGAVTGLLASLQRQPAFDAREFIEDAASPGLTAAVATRARAAMAANRRQQAVNIIVDALVEDGTIDRALLRGGRMLFDPGLAADGAARVPLFRLVGGQRVANRTRVRIGPTAFGRGLPWLFSTILHEYRHVEQFQQTNAPERPLSGHNNWLEARQEVDAFLHEIENARSTGLFANARQMREVWRRLHEERWIGVDRAGRRALNERYIAAHAIVRQAVGPDVRLGFSPLAPAPAGAP